MVCVYIYVYTRTHIYVYTRMRAYAYMYAYSNKQYFFQTKFPSAVQKRVRIIEKLNNGL